MENELKRTLQFDLYGRYSIIRDIIFLNQSENGKKRVLDVGGRGNILRRFMPNEDVYYLDPNIDSYDDNFIVGNGCKIPSPDRSFQWVVSADVYEHVPEMDREKFIEESLRVASEGVILIAPFDAEDVATYEKDANEVFKSIHGYDHVWLKEHIENGLPDGGKLETFLNTRGYAYKKMYNNYLPLWFLMSAVSFFAGENLDDKKVLNMYEDINLFYNSNMAKYDNTQPAYRSVYCISKNGNEIIVPTYSKACDFTAVQHECVFRSFKLLGYIEKKNKVLKRKKEITKLYINVDNEYSEENTVTNIIDVKSNGEKNIVEFDIDCPFSSLRWDPIDMKGCILKIMSIYAYGKDGIAEYPVGSIRHNGKENENGWIEFWTLDPNVYFDLSGVYEKIKIVFCMEILDVKIVENRYFEIEDEYFKIKNKCSEIENRYSGIKKSYSYRIGSIITYPAKKILRMFN